MSEVRCRAEAWTAVEEHVFSTLDREVGGILVGTVDDQGAQVRSALPALAATSGSANVTFTHEVWEQVHAAMDRDHPDERIVGWYHSHPGFGVFLSEYDRFAHSSFFSDPDLLALVVDPHSGEAGWFAMRDGEPTQIASRTTSRAGARPRAEAVVAAARGSSSTSRRLLVAAGAALAAAVVGFLIGASTSSPTVVAPAGRTSGASPGPATPPSPTVSAPAPSVAPPAAPAPTAAEPVASSSAAGPAALDYRVRRGDSFSALALAFYGDATAWPRLRAANPGHASDLLEVGEHLSVPVRLEP